MAVTGSGDGRLAAQNLDPVVHPGQALATTRDRRADWRSYGTVMKPCFRKSSSKANASRMPSARMTSKLVQSTRDTFIEPARSEETAACFSRSLTCLTLIRGSRSRKRARRPCRPRRLVPHMLDNVECRAESGTARLLCAASSLPSRRLRDLEVHRAYPESSLVA